MIRLIQAFGSHDLSSSFVFIIEMVLLGEYSLFFLYLLVKLIQLLTYKKKTKRSVVLNIALSLSSIIRIVLFLPPQVPSTNTITVIDIFTAPVCYFTAVSSLISQWYDILILTGLTDSYSTKYLKIRRFTLTILISNLTVWLLFFITIIFAEAFDKNQLVKYLLLYDLVISCFIFGLLGSIGISLRIRIYKLIDGNRIKLTTWINIIVGLTFLKIAATGFMLIGQLVAERFINEQGWVAFFLCYFTVCEVLSMAAVYQTERVSSKIFEGTAIKSMSLSSLAASITSLSSIIPD